MVDSAAVLAACPHQTCTTSWVVKPNTARKKKHADCWWLKFGKLTSWGNGSLSHYLPWASEHHPTSGIFSPDFSTINQFSSASSALEVDTNQVTAKRVGHSSHCLGTELFSAGNQEVVKTVSKTVTNIYDTLYGFIIPIWKGLATAPKNHFYIWPWISFIGIKRAPSAHFV